MVLVKCEVGVEVPDMSGGRESTAIALNCGTVSYFDIGRNEAEENGIIALVTDEVSLYDIKIRRLG
jgi:hypothetical protein